MNSLPQWFLVMAGLVVGLALIFIANPPHSKCDSQFEVFKKTQTPFLFLDAKKANMTKTLLTKSIVECRGGNNSGACFTFFDGVDRMTKELQSITKECVGDIKSRDEVNDGIWKSMNFIFELAWGAKPPKNEYERFSWFDHLNLLIYCNLRDFIFNNYRKETWEEFREKILASLPGASELGREKTWKLSLFTLNCSAINGQPK